MPKSSIIIVSGLPRSGTSLMMQILDKAGVASLTDNLRTADADNPRGYYEYEPVKHMKDSDTGWIRLAKGKAVKIISHLLQNLPAGQDYKIVFMLRNLAEVVASQARMLQNRGQQQESSVSKEDLVEIFAAHLESVRLWLHEQPNIKTIYIDYNNLVDNPQASLMQVSTFLGIDLTKPEILAVVDSNYYRQRESK